MILRFNYQGSSYARIFCDRLSNSMAKNLKQNFDYVYVVAYKDIEDAEFEIIEKKSAVIPLSDNIDNVFSKFHSTTRNEIRKSLKNISILVESNIKDWNKFYNFHKNCEKDRGWIPAPLDELKKSIIVSIKYLGDYIAAFSCYEGEGMLRVDRIFSARKSSKFEKLRSVIFSSSSRRIVYELCKIGIGKECRFLDLGGVDLNDPVKRGISEFKMKFGSQIIPVKIGRFYNNKLKFENKLDFNKIDVL